MKPLSKKELQELLEFMSVEEIRNTKGNQLNDEAMIFLDAEERDINQAETFLQDFGKQFREAHPTPEIDLPLWADSSQATAEPEGKQQSERQQGWLSFFQKAIVPNWALAFIFLVIMIPFSSLDLGMDSINLDRERSGNHQVSDISEVNQALVKVLINRADFLMTASRNNPELYKEALSDLFQAYQLDESNKRFSIDFLAIKEERSTKEQVKGIDALNQALVKALIARAEFLMAAAPNKPVLHQEALTDLLQAYQLEKRNEPVLRNLALVYEQLGEDKKAQQFFEQWNTHLEEGAN